MLRSLTRFWGVLLALGLAVTQSCSHRTAELPTPTTAAITGVSISEAQAWYKENYSNSSVAANHNQAPSVATSATTPTSAELLWQRALTVSIGNQQLVLVPFAGSDAILTHNAYAGPRYLIVAKPTSSSLEGRIVEVILRRTKQPIDTLALFTSLYQSYQSGNLTAPTQGEGYVFLYSANYQYLTGRRFKQGQLLPEAARLAFQLRPGTAAASNARSTADDGGATTNMAPPIGDPCLDWYNAQTGSYITTTGNCTSGDDGGSPPPIYTGGGGPCGGSCGGSPGPSGYGGGSGGSGTVSPTSVVVKPSVSNNPKANCVLTKLQNVAQFNQLLKGFQNTSKYNVSFNMGPIASGSTGNCSWDYNTSTANVLVNEGIFNTQHAIYGATTFFHETYHAQLQQYAIATFGTLEINKWPKPINNMTFQELITYVDATSATNTQWKTATHNYMAYNNAIMAEGLRVFIEINYPITYSQIGPNMTKYNYLSMMGLENTTRFRDEVTNQGKKSEYISALADFVSNELPECL